MMLSILISILLSLQTTVDVTFPEDGFVAGWEKSGPMLRFVKEDLYNYINGGAALFHEFGFEELMVQRYTSGEDEITMEAYRMEAPESALGIYLMKCGVETPVKEIPFRHSGSRLQFLLTKGNYFVVINNYSGKGDFQPIMATMSQTLLAPIPDDKPVELFDLLPEENLVKGSELIIKGPYALEPIYTFGHGDVLLLDGKVFGVVGDYLVDRELHTKIVIAYPRQNWASSALESLIRNLDPLYESIEQWDTGLIFKDFQQKYGLALLNENILTIQIKLSKEPSHW